MSSVARWLLFTGLLALAIFILVAVGLFAINTVSIEQLNRLSGSVGKFGFYSQFLRWLVYLGAWFFWDRLITAMSEWYKWSEYMEDRALNSRYSTTLCVLCVEILIIQNAWAYLTGKLIEAI